MEELHGCFGHRDFARPFEATQKIELDPRLRQHHGRLLVNPGSVGLAFKDYVGGRIPTILNHAEYAMIEECDGAMGVSLRRLPLDKGKLRQAQSDTEHPLGPWLREQYV